MDISHGKWVLHQISSKYYQIALCKYQGPCKRDNRAEVIERADQEEGKRQNREGKSSFRQKAVCKAKGRVAIEEEDG